MITDITAVAQTAFYFMLVFSVQLLLILALRKPVRLWLGARQAYWLWALPLVWLPFYFWSGKLGVLFENLFTGLSTFLTTEAATAETAYNQEGFISTSRDLFTDLLTPLYPTAGYTAEIGIMILLTLTVLWISGLLILAGLQYSRLYRFRKYLKTHSVPAPHPGVISSDTACLALRAMEGPAVFGILRPVLLIPEDYYQRFDSNQRHLMMAHEQVHIERRDNLWNLFAEAIRILFWFNPLMHIAYRCYRLDQELSCDALALDNCNASQQEKYALTLLTCYADTFSYPPSFASTQWGNLQDLKTRSLMVKRHIKQKNTHLKSLITGLTLVCSGGLMSTLYAQNEERLIELPEFPAFEPNRNGFNVSITEQDQWINISDYFIVPEYQQGDKPLSMILRRFIEPINRHEWCLDSQSEIQAGQAQTTSCQEPTFGPFSQDALVQLIGLSEDRWTAISKVQRNALCTGQVMPGINEVPLEAGLQQIEALSNERDSELEHYLSEQVSNMLGADGVENLRQWDRDNPVQQHSQHTMLFDLTMFYEGTGINPFTDFYRGCGDGAIHYALRQRVILLSTNDDAPAEPGTIEDIMSRMDPYQSNTSMEVSLAAMEEGLTLYRAGELSTEEAIEYWNQVVSIYALEGDHSGATAALLKVIEHSSQEDQFSAMNRLASRYTYARDYEKALETRLQLLNEYANETELTAYLNKDVAHAYIDLDDYENARPYVMASADLIREGFFEPVSRFNSFSRDDFEDRITYFEIAGDSESADRLTEYLNAYNPPVM